MIFLSSKLGPEGGGIMNFKLMKDMGIEVWSSLNGVVIKVGIT